MNEQQEDRISSIEPEAPTAAAGMDLPQSASDFLASMAMSYNYVLSDFEALMWTTRVFSRFDDASVVRALIRFMETTGRDRAFFPRYGMILEMLEAPAAATDLDTLVREGSPYTAPDIQDPVLLMAISLLGGWARVCQELPDARENPTGHTVYMKRVQAAMTQAATAVQVHGAKPPQLVAIGGAASSASLALSYHQAAQLPQGSQEHVPAAAAPGAAGDHA